MPDVTADMVIQQMKRMMSGDWIYRFGAEVHGYPNDPASKRSDCSEATESAVRWAAESVGSSLRLTDGSFLQHDACYKAGTLIPLAEARKTPGSLVFLSRVMDVTPGMGRNGIYHVGLVENENTVLEACCKNGDVLHPVNFPQRNWYKLGGKIPGVVYPVAPPPQTQPPQPQPPQVTVVLQVEGSGTVSLRMLKKGHEGRDVRQYQALLEEFGMSPGKHDGIFGSGTDSATRKFQQARGLAVDGVVGSATWSSVLGR